MTKISALSDIGTSVASNDVFVLVDASDPTTPNKKIQHQNFFLIPDGSAATPGLRFLNDTDTGIYRPGAKQLAISTNGVERLRITSDGKLGLGTSSPGALLHSVNTSAGAATVAAVIQNSSSSINTEVRLVFSPNNNPITDERYAYVGSINETGSTSVSLTFGTGAGQPPIERLRITSAGVLQIADAGDIAVGTTTGTKIGTATSQKISFYNATPVVQPTTGVAEAAFVENFGGTAVNVDSTFGGYTIQQVVEALQTLGLLA